LHLDAEDVATDEVTVIAVCANREMLADGASDASLDLRCRHPANGSGTPGLAVEKGRRDVIPIPDTKFAGVARAHSVATVVIDAAN
jgi:hypothetical protein